MVWLKCILRLPQFLYRHRRAKVKWSPPPRTKIAIFDATSSRFLVPLCGSEKFEIIHVDGESLNLTFAIVKSTIKWALKTGLPQVGYAIAQLEAIRPVITLTFIDNSRLFYETSRHYRKTRFLAVQNAARHDTAHLPAALAKKIHIPEFACFGEFEKELYKRIGANVGCFYPVGSLRDAYYREQFGPLNSRIEYDICIVGEASPGWDKREFPGMEDAIGNIAKHAERYAIKFGKRICLASKRPALAAREREMRWYGKYIGDRVEVIGQVPNQYTTYGLIDRSAVSVGFISTALHEGLARGRRVLFCNYTGLEKWDFPAKGLWCLTDPSYEAFEKKMDELFAMSEETFREQSADAARYTVNYRPELPTHHFLQRLIADAVSPGRD